MPLSVAQLITQLRGTTGQDIVSLPDIDSVSTIGALTFLNRSFWSICNKYDFRLNETSATGVTVAGTSSYTPPATMDAVSNISLLDPTTLKYFRLDPMTIDVYRTDQSTRASDQTIPTNYIRYGSQFLLWPTPDKVYTYQVDFLQSLSDLITSGNPPIPREWDEAIAYGAAWRVFSDVNGDLARAQWYKNLEANITNTIVPVQAKEEMDYANAGVNVKGRSY